MEKLDIKMVVAAGSVKTWMEVMRIYHILYKNEQARYTANRVWVPAS